MTFYLFMCLWTAASLAVITVAAVHDDRATRRRRLDHHTSGPMS